MARRQGYFTNLLYQFENHFEHDDNDDSLVEQEECTNHLLDDIISIKLIIIPSHPSTNHQVLIDQGNPRA